MMADAHKRCFDLVLVWALDRCGPLGMVATIGHLQRLASCGVSSRLQRASPVERQRDAARHRIGSDGGAGETGSRRISERTNAGMKRARAEGKSSVGRHCRWKRDGESRH
jgi:DNA invertase Pin-like site-specific DNA recombinase